MIALVRQYAEVITQLCRLKINVTIKGQEFELKISYLHYISRTQRKIFSENEGFSLTLLKPLPL